MTVRKAVVFLIGPTASGKTDVVLRLAGRLPLEVISCDSMQVYRSMPVLSQAPDPSVLRRVRHHLVACLSPREEYSAAAFVDRARSLIAKIGKRKRVPFVVGGTGLYVNALLDGIFRGPGSSAVLRRLFEERAGRNGVTDLYEELKQSDPAVAGRIHPHDKRRIVRALEVITLTKKPLSGLKLERRGIWDEGPVFIYGILRDRRDLYQSIDRRVDAMVRRGLFREAESVIAMGPSKTAAACLGIKETQAVMEGRMSPPEAVEALKRHTRNFAKRQICWFKRDSRIRWIPSPPGIKAEDIAGEIEKDLWKRLSLSPS